MADTGMAGVEVQGTCEMGFEPVRKAFIANFSQLGEVGASVAIVRDGETVVDLWAGHSDAGRTKPWRRDTLANVWSTTKGMGALVCGMLVERGLMSYDDKVATYWPEFAAAGKGDITVGQMLSHQAGLCGPVVPTTSEEMCNHALMAERLAAQAPIWAPGSRSGYHALTVGILAGELVGRVSGKTIGTFFREEVAEPFGVDFFIGLPASEDARVAEMIPAKTSNMPDPSTLNVSQIAALGNPAPDPRVPNERFWRRAELSSANGQGSAFALARVYGALASGGKIDGKPLVQPETIRAMTTLQIEGPDEVLGMPARWGAGYILNVGGLYGPNDEAFGHSGWGGSFGMADPKTGLGIAYTMNQMGPDLAGDVRANAIIAAAYASL
ncbi:MAG: serine hydrolase domain-containing protein [Parvibaculum sp.]|uniref:serine hydrolase domain-containing protein n=1 Tax=Parvibaculum sp. TaxID=2024848 RepID=UPI002ABC61C2|nr:serine hydrolase domain-containing protein [Parvibaculum sp.]MDZ4380549.1 serine hydrolase domain-containing protein [Parvibaculum sp.]